MIPAASRPGRWTACRPLEIARSHSPVVAHDGRLYVFGGGGPNFKSLNSVTAYDPATDTWERCRDMPSHRSGTVATLVGDRIFVMGGGFKQENGTFRFLRTLEIYHPREDRWESGPDLNQPHDYPALAVLNGQLYVLGGHHPDATLAGPKTDPGFDFCERLTPDAGGWERIAPLPTPRFALAAVTLNDTILAMGGVAFRPEGFDNFTLVERYDAQADRWSLDQTLTLPWPAAGLGAALLGNELYVFGGYSSDNIHPRTAVFRDGHWQQAASLPSPVAAMGVTTFNGRIYAVGGWADDGRTPINSVYAYEA